MRRREEGGRRGLHAQRREREGCFGRKEEGRTRRRREKHEDVYVHVRGRRRVGKWCGGEVGVGGRGGLGEEGGEGGAEE